MLVILHLLILTFVASLIGMVAGFATSTTMIPIMLLFFDIHQTLIFVGIIHLFTDIGKLLFSLEGIKFRFLLWFVITTILGSFLGAKITYLIDKEIILRILGLIFILYVITIFYEPKLQLKANKITAINGGFSSGFISGLTGIGGSVRAMFLSIYNLPKLQYISTLGILGLFADITRLGTYLSTGYKMPLYLWKTILIALPVSLLASWLGRVILNFVPQKNFRYIVGIFLVFVAITLIIWPKYFIHASI